MSVPAGATVSRYQFVGPLGTGGMGEVYKAHDTVLGRGVALKILPRALVSNEERTRRFVQEARAASSLNHPNIVTIYEIGEAPLTTPETPGSAGEPIHFIAMELIDGVTLRRKIYEDAAPLRTLLTYIAQAAEGLAKAHAAGIVHRDLKPDNIMVTTDGFAKVLDFGLAKLVRPLGGGDAQTRTISAHDDTRDGVILGTVAYMSPEQVQGKTADHRSDIFAIGTILYEAASRRRPFSADSDVEIMHKILHDKPEPVADLNPQVPAELRRVIRRCLAKEPDRRYQSMKDLAIELSEIVDEFEQLSLSTTPGSGSSTIALPAAPPKRSRRLAAAALVILALAGVGSTAWLWNRSAETPRQPVSYETMQMRPLTVSGRVFRAPAISPDGRYVAYVRREPAGFSLWMQQVATGSDVKIIPERPDQITGPVFSPDGNYLYYLSAERNAANYVYSWLYVVPTIGGQPRKVVFDVDTAVAFSPDGKQIAFGRGVPRERENHLIVANADGTGERVVASFRRVQDAAGAAWSPDGTKILTAALDLTAGWDVALLEIDAASGASRRIGSTRRFSVSDLDILPDGSGILLAAADAESAREQIWLQPYPDGTPSRVTNDLSDYRGLSMSADGAAMAAVKVDTRTSLVLTSVDDRGPGKTLTPAGQSRLEDVTVSHTGVIAYAFANGHRTDIAVLDSAESAPRVITREGFNYGPAISADGRTIVYSSESENGPPHVYAIGADGSNPRQITDGPHESEADLSADGRTILYSAAFGSEIWVKPLEGGDARRLTERANGPGRLSPDGRHAVFLEWVSEERVAAALKVVPVDGGPPLLEVPWNRGLDFRWHPDGTRITFRRFDAGVNNLFAIPLTGGEPARITNFEGGTFSSYAWTADGRLVLVRADITSDVVLITDWRADR